MDSIAVRDDYKTRACHLQWQRRLIDGQRPNACAVERENGELSGHASAQPAKVTPQALGGAKRGARDDGRRGTTAIVSELPRQPVSIGRLAAEIVARLAKGRG